ncbi:MAG: type II toxin-antitoxin system PemK/MazF family toxin [Lachnospiraceae bacterium]|nr:type II toxin-antitoxin system PemK/MazF family toxin [Lachnospiraceae bacterium]
MRMMNAAQGDILKVEKIGFPVLVVSKDFFNESGEIIGCPVLKETSESPLHIFISADGTEGYVCCEKLKLLDLRMRGYKRTGKISTAERMNIADAVQGIFDYL